MSHKWQLKHVKTSIVNLERGMPIGLPLFCCKGHVCTLLMDQIEFITPTPPLKAKTGTGGIDNNILDKANEAMSSLSTNVEDNIKQHLEKLKIHIHNETLIRKPSEETMEDFIFDLLPLKVDSQMSQNKNLAIIAEKLLNFVETLQTMNVDAYHIIRAHVNALNLVVQSNVNDENHKFSRAVLTELDDACHRFNKK